MRRSVAVALLLTAVVASCGGDDAATVDSPFPDGAFAFGASSVLGLGQERVLIAIQGEDGSRLASPDIPVTVAAWPEGLEDMPQVRPTAFVWAVEGVSGLYRATFDFDRVGTWYVEVTPEGGGAMDPFPISVTANSPVPAVGDPAPASETPTGDEFPLAEISSDTDPDPRFYELSVADAVVDGRPTVVVFATPAFCQTAVCGPTLDVVKGIIDDHPDVDFVHVEVYTNLDDAANLEIVPAVVEWGLPTEPWVFVVDADGNVAARFEGVISPDEIAAALPS